MRALLLCSVILISFTDPMESAGTEPVLFAGGEVTIEGTEGTAKTPAYVTVPHSTENTSKTPGYWTVAHTTDASTAGIGTPISTPGYSTFTDASSAVTEPTSGTTVCKESNKTDCIEGTSSGSMGSDAPLKPVGTLLFSPSKPSPPPINGLEKRQIGSNNQMPAPQFLADNPAVTSAWNMVNAAMVHFFGHLREMAAKKEGKKPKGPSKRFALSSNSQQQQQSGSLISKHGFYGSGSYYDPWYYGSYHNNYYPYGKNYYPYYYGGYYGGSSSQQQSSSGSLLRSGLGHHVNDYAYGHPHATVIKTGGSSSQQQQQKNVGDIGGSGGQQQQQQQQQQSGKGIGAGNSQQQQQQQQGESSSDVAIIRRKRSNRMRIKEDIRNF